MTAEIYEIAAALEDGAEAFLADRLTTDEVTPDALWPELQRLGWFDVLVPEADGGLGLPPMVLGGMVRASGRHLLPGPLLEHLLVAPWLLSRAHESASALLAPVVAGSSWLAFADPAAVAADGAHSAADGVAVAAGPETRSDGTLTGVVRLVPHADRADTLAVVTDGGLVLVQSSDPGVRVEPRAALTDVHEVADVHLDGARGVLVTVSAAELDELRAWIRLLTAAWLSGTVERVLRLTVDYVGQREQFGRVVGSFQAVQHTVADMAADALALANLVSLALVRTGDGAGPGFPDALAAKAYAAQTALRVCEAALQMHGGIGFTTDYPLHRYYASTLALQGYYGEPERLFVELGRAAMRQ